MSNPLTEAGVFRGCITEYGLRDTESGAIGVTIRARIDDGWDSENKEWADWRPYAIEAIGTLWIIKKDGTVNQLPTESLIKFAGWNGDIEAIGAGLWIPTECQFSVNEERPNEYHEATQYRIAFINQYDRIPGAVGNVTPEKAKELQSRFGAQFRALAGSAAQNAAKPPTTKPKMPNAKAPLVGGPIVGDARRVLEKAKIPVDINAELQEAAGGDDIPF